MTLLDTNVLSEVLKPAPSEQVMAWLASQQRSTIFTTVVTQAEILCGLELLPQGKRKMRLEAAIGDLFREDFEARVLAFDEAAARIYAKIVVARERVGRPISQFDAMIAAITRSKSATLATRNTSDFEGCGIRITNPWTS